MMGITFTVFLGRCPAKKQRERVVSRLLASRKGFGAGEGGGGSHHGRYDAAVSVTDGWQQTRPLPSPARLPPPPIVHIAGLA
eukprot:1443350-Rhodomonas_salina.1